MALTALFRCSAPALVAATVLAPASSVAAETAPPPPDLPEEEHYLWYLCRLDPEQAEQVAPTVSSRALARQWKAYLQDMPLDEADLARITGDREDRWLARLWVSDIVYRGGAGFSLPPDFKEPGLRTGSTIDAPDSDRAYIEVPIFDYSHGLAWSLRLESDTSSHWLLFDTGAAVSFVEDGVGVNGSELGTVAVVDGAGLSEENRVIEMDVHLGVIRLQAFAAVRGIDMPGFALTKGHPELEGIVGWNIIGRLRWGIDTTYERRALVFTKSRAERRNLWFAGTPVVRVTIDGRPALAEVDTGNQQSELTELGARRLGYETRGRVRERKTVFGNATAQRLRDKARLDFEGAELKIKIAAGERFSPQDGPCVDAVIGADMLKKHKYMVLDGPAGFVRFGKLRPEASEKALPEEPEAPGATP